MGYKYVTREDFRSLNELMETLSRRPNNEFMKSEDSSRSGSARFTGSSSWEEALKMLTDGYLDILGQLRDDVKEKDKITSKYAQDLAHPIPHTEIVGYSPCVPNAILGLPNSMISVDRIPMKRKTLSILYAMGANCGKSTEYFEKAGAALLSAINLIEKSGIQTELKLCFFPALQNDELLFPTVCIKHYGERFSLQKVSFPLAHTSMFRRIGFKWCETTPDAKTSFAGGYGYEPDFDEVEKALNLDANTKYISINYIQQHNCSVEQILKKLGVIT